MDILSPNGFSKWFNQVATQCNQVFPIIFDYLNYSFKVACLFETQYHTVQTNFASIDVDETVSDVQFGESIDAKEKHLISTITGFRFNLTLTTDEQLKEQLPSKFHHIVRDMNHFKISYNKNIEKHKNTSTTVSS